MRGSTGKYAASRKAVQECSTWLKQVPWQLFCTLTFAWKVSDQQAIAIFKKFIDQLERLLKNNVCHVRGNEKRFSGCGKPACGRHFHVLLASNALMTPAIVERLWTSMAGQRPDKAGALVEPSIRRRTEFNMS
jgi:hypothetical protein